MKLGKLGLLSAAVLLAGGLGTASAQSTMSPGSSSPPSATSGKCWDSASRQIKDLSENDNQTASGAKKPGGVTTGSAPTGSAAEGSGSMSSTSRPAAAAGLPDC